MNIASVFAAVLAVLIIPVVSIAREVPSMPNECATTRCAAMVASAQLICSEEQLDEEICDLVLSDLAECVEGCTESE